MNVNNTHQIKISYGRVLDPHSGLDEITNVYIEDGKIVAIAKNDPENFSANKHIDASDKLVCPGLVDLCARFREPGQEYKATIASEMIAAAKAGITTTCLPPDTDPVIDEPSIAELIQKRAAKKLGTKIVTLGALTLKLKGEQLAEMAALKEVGCVGVSNGQQAVSNLLILRRAMEYAANNNLTFHASPMEQNLAYKGVAHAGKVATRLGLPGIPVSAETIAIAQLLELAEELGTRLHIGRLSAAKSIELIANAQQRGIKVTADVAAHQLHLTEMDLLDFNSTCHVIPPLRSERDKEALIAACKSGVITAICSDHQPVNSDAKLAPFPSTEPGISALETFLPLVLRLVDNKVLNLSEALALITSKPADILGIEAGRLKVGAVADICIIDPEQRWTLTEADILSQGKNTAFLHWDFKGRAITTLINGKLLA